MALLSVLPASRTASIINSGAFCSYKSAIWRKMAARCEGVCSAQSFSAFLALFTTKSMASAWIKLAVPTTSS